MHFPLPDAKISSLSLSHLFFYFFLNFWNKYLCQINHHLGYCFSVPSQPRTICSKQNTYSNYNPWILYTEMQPGEQIRLYPWSITLGNKRQELSSHFWQCLFWGQGQSRYSSVHMANISCQDKLLPQNKFKEERMTIYFGFGVWRQCSRKLWACCSEHTR